MCIHQSLHYSMVVAAVGCSYDGNLVIQFGSIRGAGNANFFLVLIIFYYLLQQQKITHFCESKPII